MMDKIDNLIHDALATDVDEDRLYLYKQHKSDIKEIKNMKPRYIVKPAIAVALCAGLVFGISKIPTAENFTENQGAKTSIVQNIEKAFTISALAASQKNQKKKMEKNIAVAVSTTDSDSGDLWFGDHSTLEVGYSVGAPLLCEGKDIDKITYSINKGAFEVIGFENNDFVIEGEKSEMKKFKSSPFTMDIGNNLELEFVGVGTEQTETKAEEYTQDFYKSYTVSADNQLPDGATISICDIVKTDEEVFKNLWDFTSLDELKKGRDKLFEDLVITCEVLFKDGSTETKKIDVGSKIMTPDESGIGSIYTVETWSGEDATAGKGFSEKLLDPDRDSSRVYTTYMMR